MFIKQLKNLFAAVLINKQESNCFKKENHNVATLGQASVLTQGGRGMANEGRTTFRHVN